jgi:hypothetical protein
MVAAAKSWSSFSHRAYGELRRLPLDQVDADSPDSPGLDDDRPSWQVLGDP